MEACVKKPSCSLLLLSKVQLREYLAHLNVTRKDPDGQYFTRDCKEEKLQKDIMVTILLNFPAV